MTDNYNNLPEARVEAAPRFSFIWFIPLIAALVAGWLVYKVYSEKGEIVTILFDNAEGIEPKKTPVRYKDVNVGKVTNISLDKQLNKVQVEVEIKPFMAKHLGQESHFWVVRPRVTVQGVSGLTTLISGIYISVDPGESGKRKRVYTGLEKPPRVTSYEKGRSFVLQAARLGSIDAGSPVYYRQINVGEVIDYKLNDDQDTVGINVFIKSPFDDIVRRNTLFWNISGLDVELSPSGGVTARMESLTSLLVGGIAFETPHNLADSLPVTPDTVFPLYETYDDAKERNRGERLFYVMYFSETLRGLEIGAPVEYRGIQIGKVEDIQLKIEQGTDAIKIPVLISVYAEKLSFDGDREDAEDIMHHLVGEGLRGQLTTSNYITGAQFISMVFPEKPDETPNQIKESSESGLAYAEIPTTPGLTKMLAQSATEIMDEIHSGIKDARKLINSPALDASSKDIAAILDNVRTLLAEVKPEIIVSMNELTGTLKNTRQITGKLNNETVSIADQLKKTLTRLDGALAEARVTLKTANNTLGEDSALQYELRLLIEEVNEAANSFSVLADTLQRKPNSVIFGK